MSTSGSEIRPPGSGFKTKLVYFAYGDDRTLQCEMVQNYLGAIGIQVEVTKLDYGVWIDQYLNGKYEAMALGFTVPAGGMELGHDWTQDLTRRAASSRACAAAAREPARVLGRPHRAR